MNSLMPPPALTWKAIEIYLAIAYPGEAPVAVRNRLEALRSAEASDFYGAGVFEQAASEGRARCCLRLGNCFYPHMKLVIEPAPDGTQVLYRADTHDRHVQVPPGSPEAAALAELARKNQDFSTRIEAAWDERGLPTFKRYLREDLARRRSERTAQNQSNV